MQCSWGACFAQKRMVSICRVFTSVLFEFRIQLPKIVAQWLDSFTHNGELLWAAVSGNTAVVLRS